MDNLELSEYLEALELTERELVEKLSRVREEITSTKISLFPPIEGNYYKDLDDDTYYKVIKDNVNNFDTLHINPGNFIDYCQNSKRVFLRRNIVKVSSEEFYGVLKKIYIDFKNL